MATETVVVSGEEVIVTSMDAEMIVATTIGEEAMVAIEEIQGVGEEVEEEEEGDLGLVREIFIEKKGTNLKKVGPLDEKEILNEEGVEAALHQMDHLPPF